MNKKYISPIEIAEDLGLTVKAVMGLIRRKELPAYQVGSQIRIRSDHFEDFLNKAKIQETANG